MKSIPTEFNATQFPPGHFWYDGKLEQHWKHEYEQNNHTEEEIVSNLRKLLDSEVRLRLLSERPIGCILSGGLDSTCVTALVRKYIPK